jgi:hypothetical protein
MGTPESGRAAHGKCPICKSPAERRFRPFCSKRCAEIDLSRWLGGSYAVPAVELDENDLDELERFIDGTETPSDDGDDSTEDRG